MHSVSLQLVLAVNPVMPIFRAQVREQFSRLLLSNLRSSLCFSMLLRAASFHLCLLTTGSVICLLDIELPAEPLISRETLLKTSQIGKVTTDIHLKWISYTVPSKEGSNSVCWRALGDIQHSVYGKLSCLRLPGLVTELQWMADNRTLLLYQGSYSTCKVWMLDVSAEVPLLRKLSDLKGYVISVYQPNRWKPHEILVTLARRGDVIPQPYILNTKTLESKLLFKNRYFDKLYFRFDYELMLASNVSERGQTNYYSVVRGPKNSYSFVFWKSITEDVALLSRPTIYTTADQYQYWLTSEYTDKVSLVLEKPDSSSYHILYEPDLSDINSVLFDQITFEPLLITTSYVMPEVNFVHDKIAEDYLYLVDWFGTDEFRVSSISPTLDRWLVIVESDVISATLYLYVKNGNKSRVAFLFSQNDELRSVNVPRKRAAEVPIKGDFVQLCYVTMPDDGGSGAGINLVHGGPAERLYWKYDYESALWANRGYVVLQCQFRGSTGFGKRFVAAGFGQWGADMQQDLDDAVLWAAANRLVDANRMAIVGSSYGGYAALHALAFTPEKYRCAIANCAASNLVSLVESLPQDWRKFRARLIQEIGSDVDTVDGRMFLWNRSPVSQVTNIRRPLLLSHGLFDDRLPMRDTDNFVAALIESGANFTYLVFPDEFHCTEQHRNRIVLAAISEQFLSKCLGGRSEALSDALSNVDITLEEYPHLKKP